MRKELIIWEKELMFWEKELMFWEKELMFWEKELMFWEKEFMFWEKKRKKNTEITIFLHNFTEQSFSEKNELKRWKIKTNKILFLNDLKKRTKWVVHQW